MRPSDSSSSSRSDFPSIKPKGHVSRPKSPRGSAFQPTDTLWQNGLFGCFSDVSLCCMAMLCPCIVGGKNAEGVKESCCLYGFLTCIPGFSVIGNMIIRGKIREKFLIDGGFAEDLMASCCCGCCAAVQEGQELKLRDPNTGAIKRV